jgi:hypothetical protein
MQNKLGLKSALATASFLMLVLSGCGGRSLIFAGEAEPADFSLSFQMPEEFDFEITGEEIATYDFALELTYFAEQMQGWTEIPLYYILTRPDAEEDKRFNFPVKEGDKWLGELLANEHDRIYEQDIEKGLQLTPGKYNLKLYGDSKEQGKPILGIVKVTFKVYKAG